MSLPSIDQIIEDELNGDVTRLPEILQQKIKTFGSGIMNPQLHLVLLEAHVMEMFKYMVDILLSSTSDDVRQQAKQDFEQYAAMDKLVRLYNFVRETRGKKLVVPEG